MLVVSSEIISTASEMNKHVEIYYNEYMRWDNYGRVEKQYYEPDLVDAAKEYLKLESNDDRSHFLKERGERTKMILNVTLLAFYSLI